MRLAKSHYTDIFYFGLILIVVALPLSMFLISVAQFILLGSWLLEGDLKNKLSAFWKNKAALLITSVFLIHLIGLLYTTDYKYGFHDIRVKLPLLLLPLLISTAKPLSQRRLNMLFSFFIIAVFAATVISTLILTGYTEKVITDARHASVFISHIRFSLLICIAICILFNFCFIILNRWVLIGVTALILWFTYYLILTQSATGIVVLAVLGFVFLLLGAFKKSNSNTLKIGFSLSLLIIGLASGAYIHRQVNNFYSIKESKTDLTRTTKRGNAYIHYIQDDRIENGYYIGLYNCPLEMEEEWKKRSSISLNDKDLKNQHISYTLSRYLTSKGLRKDAEGILQLSDQDIKAIEAGHANYKFLKLNGIESRIYQILWEYQNYKGGWRPNGHSLTMRFEFWKAALFIIADNFITGVGTGDVKSAFDQKYEEINTPLDKEWRLRAHNQYFSIAIAFGIGGLILFLTSLIFPFFLYKNIHPLYVAFFVIAALSMITEDTLETSAGVTMFALFNSLFLFKLNSQQKDAPELAIRQAS